MTEFDYLHIIAEIPMRSTFIFCGIGIRGPLIYEVSISLTMSGSLPHPYDTSPLLNCDHNLMFSSDDITIKSDSLRTQLKFFNGKGSNQYFVFIIWDACLCKID